VDLEAHKAKHASECKALSEREQELVLEKVRLEGEVTRLTRREADLQGALAQKLEQTADELHAMQVQHKADKQAWEDSTSAKLCAVEAARQEQVAVMQASPFCNLVLQITAYL
jgi:hypothetical protein